MLQLWSPVGQVTRALLQEYRPSQCIVQLLLFGQVILEFWHVLPPVQLMLAVSMLGSVMVALLQEERPLQFIVQVFLYGHVILELWHEEDPVQLKVPVSVLGSVMVALMQEYWPLQLKHSLPRPQTMVEDWQDRYPLHSTLQSPLSEGQVMQELRHW